MNSRTGRYMLKEGVCFIGRKEELAEVTSWLEGEEAETRLFAVTGIGGIGKSTFMTEISRLGKSEGCLCIWLDGRTFPPTPAAFLENLAAAAAFEQLGQPYGHPLQMLTEAGPQRRVMLFIDNFEEISLLEGWLLHAFLPKLPAAGAAVLLASRPRLPLTWIAHPFWGTRITEFTLAKFSNEEMHDYIVSFGSFTTETAGRLVRMSDGHPLALALSVDAAMREGGEEPHKQAISQSISARVLHEVASPQLQPLVDVLTVLPRANQEMISGMLGTQVSLQEYRSLAELSFVRSLDDGLALHDVARMHLLRDFRQREPDRMLRLQSAAAQLLYNKLGQAGRLEQRQIASQLLMLSKDLLTPHRSYFDFSGDGLPPLEQAIATDLPQLHDMLAEWCSYSVDPPMNSIYHAFLDALFERFPESIGVVRDGAGRPVGMFIIVLLYRETGAFLQHYFPHEMSECFRPEEWKCEQDQADTYYPVLGAGSSRMPGFTREEIVGLLTLDRLSLLGDGNRAVLVATNGELKQQLLRMGFRMRPTATRACDVSWAKADVLELDFRSGNFGEWVLSFFEGEQRQPEKQKITFQQLPLEDQEQSLRKMLQSLQQPVELEEYADQFAGIGSGLELQRFLLHQLRSAEVQGLSEENRAILYAAYWLHAGNSDAAAMECSMSRATFYRHLKKAVANFARVLADEHSDNGMQG
ncbi:hypothetical protein P9847_10965 [Paenibacillus chibensis]|uniref:Bacterio-opsin activator n=1 Tax=Paenibacillus chibensis TaxID=59846 RepID=A0ABU6PUY2_9BACL|nr:hypothetical protein [Paenibacillus chibensis]